MYMEQLLLLLLLSLLLLLFSWAVSELGLEAVCMENYLSRLILKGVSSYGNLGDPRLGWGRCWTFLIQVELEDPAEAEEEKHPFCCGDRIHSIEDISKLSISCITNDCSQDARPPESLMGEMCRQASSSSPIKCTLFLIFFTVSVRMERRTLRSKGVVKNKQHVGAMVSYLPSLLASSTTSKLNGTVSQQGTRSGVQKRSLVSCFQRRNKKEKVQKRKQVHNSSCKKWLLLNSKT